MHNFLIRALVAVIAIPAVLWIFHQGDWWLRGFVALLIALSCIEIWKVASQKRIPYCLPIGLVLTLSLPFVIFRFESTAWGVWVVGSLVLAGTSSVFRRNAQAAGLALLVHLGTAIWIGFGFGALLLLRDLFSNDGFAWIVFLYANLWIGDTAAYLFGTWIGGPKLSPVISPNKTIAGSVAQILSSVLIGVTYVYFAWIDAPAVLILSAALCVGVVGQIGDLFESVFKRAAGVKDFSSFIPGHGGVLDRFDSTLLAAPALWALIHLWRYL